MINQYLAAQEIVDTFIAETSDFLDELELMLVSLTEICEVSPGTEEYDILMNKIFRLIHTIKGTAGSFGFKNIESLAHSSENLLAAMRQNQVSTSRDRIELLQQSFDLFRGFLAEIQKSNSEDDSQCIELMQNLIQKIELALKPDAESTAIMAIGREISAGLFIFEDEAESSEVASKFRITEAMKTAFITESDETLHHVEQALLSIIQTDSNEEHKFLDEAFRHIHSFKGNCGFMGFNQLTKITHFCETLLEWMKTIPTSGYEPFCKSLLTAVDAMKHTLFQIKDGQGDEIKNIDQLLGDLAKDNDFLRAEMAKISKTYEINSANQKTITSSKAGGDIAKMDASITRNDVRVDLRKLDSLINFVGELVIAEAMLSGSLAASGLESEEVERALHQLKRATLDLQDVSMSVRMVPVAQTFRKMTRLVHDTSRKMNKKVRLIFRGEDTEVDKTVIEQISDPIVHCLRNAIDHGMETAELREKSGKDDIGTITLEARHEGSEVWIMIHDDGKGLDKDKITQKAKDSGCIPHDRDASTLSDQEIYAFIFEPGFSTAAKLTDISGRGVGMDVVKRNIEKIKGKVRIHSQAGAGTTIIFQIPLTLAIIDGMLVRLGSSMYTIPLLTIQESMRFTEDQLIKAPDGTEMIDVRSQFVPIIRLEDLLDHVKVKRDVKEGIVVIVDVNHRLMAFLVDEILGQQQTVIKALPSIYQYSKNIAGCAILGSGEVSLILDVNGIADALAKSYQHWQSNAA